MDFFENVTTTLTPVPFIGPYFGSLSRRELIQDLREELLCLPQTQPQEREALRGRCIQIIASYSNTVANQYISDLLSIAFLVVIAAATSFAVPVLVVAGLEGVILGIDILQLKEPANLRDKITAFVQGLLPDENEAPENEQAAIRAFARSAIASNSLCDGVMFMLPSLSSLHTFEEAYLDGISLATESRPNDARIIKDLCQARRSAQRWALFRPGPWEVGVSVATIESRLKDFGLRCSRACHQ